MFTYFRSYQVFIILGKSVISLSYCFGFKEEWMKYFIFSIQLRQYIIHYNLIVRIICFQRTFQYHQVKYNLLASGSNWPVQSKKERKRALSCLFLLLAVNQRDADNILNTVACKWTTNYFSFTAHKHMNRTG